MSIERLNKAATAAGFAMATPEVEVASPETQSETATSRAVVVVEPTARKSPASSDTSLTNWLKGYFSVFGGRQPA